MRRLLPVLSSLVALALLAGCSGDGDSAEPSVVQLGDESRVGLQHPPPERLGLRVAVTLPVSVPQR